MNFKRPWIVLRPRRIGILSLGFSLLAGSEHSEHWLARSACWPACLFCSTQDFPYPRQKSWHACPLFQYLSRKFISLPPSPQFNVVYHDEVVIARFQHCQGGRGGGKGASYSSDAISYCFQNSLLTHVPII